VGELVQGQAALDRKGRELLEVPAVGIQGVGRKSFFDSQVI
jgi:hypothetical protein